MTIVAGAPPTHTTPVALARVFVTGLGAPVVYVLLLFLAGVPRRAREAAVAPRTALAMIESLEAVGG